MLTRPAFQSPLRRGTGFNFRVAKDDQLSGVDFSPLFVGEQVSTEAIFSRGDQLESFQSPLRRGTGFNSPSLVSLTAAI